MNTILKIKNLGFSYKNQNVISNLSFEINSGSFVAIAGPNGSGKSTLLKLMCKILKPNKGNILFDDKNLSKFNTKELSQKIALVPQDFSAAFDFSVTQTVLMGRINKLGALGFAQPNDFKIVKQAIEATEISHLKDRSINELSGGERQRCFIARALAQETPVILLDEPTSFLDLKHQVGIYDLLKKMQLSEGKTIITVTHDINLATQYANNVLLMDNNHNCVFDKSLAVLTKENIERVYFVDTVNFEKAGIHYFFPKSNLNYPKD